jgi:hypothetical protein
VSREQRSTVRAEWSGRRSAAVTGRGEMASPTDRERDEVMHGATATCVTRGADMAAARQRQGKVAAAIAQLSCACDASVRALARGAAHRMAAACVVRGG